MQIYSRLTRMVPLQSVISGEAEAGHIYQTAPPCAWTYRPQIGTPAAAWVQAGPQKAVRLSCLGTVATTVTKEWP